MIKTKNYKIIKTKKKNKPKTNLKLTKNNIKLLKELSIQTTTQLHDKLFNDAKILIENNNFKDSSDIYLYLYNNNYNKDNIGKWLLFNSSEYSIRNYIFNKLLNNNSLNNEDKLKIYIDMISNKSKYNFNMKNYNYLIDNINILLNDENLCKSTDLFNIMYYSYFDKINFFNNIKTFCNNINKYDNSFQSSILNQLILNKENKLNNLGIYTLYDQSPAFKNVIEVISFLSILTKITLYVETDNIDEKYDKYIKNKENIKIVLVGNKNDDETIDLIKKENHIFLIFIYGFYRRKNVVLSHPAKYTFHFLDVPTLFTKHIYDYNIIDKYNYQHLYNINNNIDIDFGLLKLELPNHCTPICNNFELYRPIYNSTKIQIGLILNECKLCPTIINIINKILSKNINIYLTIYAFCDKIWLLNNFKKYTSRIDIKIYDNNNYKNELQNNLLYIDTILCSGHSTTMEIIESRRPIIAFNNNKNYFGLITTNIIRHIGMENELIANNEDDYIKLVLKYLNNEQNYYKLYDNFINNVEKSKITDNNNYAIKFYDKLNELYTSLLFNV
jgi:hypothetical protein